MVNLDDDAPTRVIELFFCYQVKLLLLLFFIRLEQVILVVTLEPQPGPHVVRVWQRVVIRNRVSRVEVFDILVLRLLSVSNAHAQNHVLYRLQSVNIVYFEGRFDWALIERKTPGAFLQELVVVK